MALAPQKFREIVLQLLYSRDLGNEDNEALQELLMKELCVSRSAIREATTKAELLASHLSDIDGAIAAISKGYALKRIPYVERNILRLGTFELYYEKTVPPKVAIAEALRLARKFATPESVSFINAILDALYKNAQGETVDDSAIIASLSSLEADEHDHNAS